MGRRWAHANVVGDSARVAVANVGNRSGSTVVFAFAGIPASAWERPDRRLIGFRRVDLPAGTTQEVSIDLDWTMLHVRDRGRWIDEEGDYLIDLAQRAHDPDRVALSVRRGG